MTCLGVHINTASMTLTVPQFRLKEMQKELTTWSNKQFCTRRELQQLLGKLSFVTSCVRPGRAFMYGLINSLKDALQNCKSQIAFSPNYEMICSGGCFSCNISMVSVIPSDIVVSSRALAMFRLRQHYVSRFIYFFYFFVDEHSALQSYQHQLTTYAFQDSTKATMRTYLRAFRLFCNYYRFPLYPLTKATVIYGLSSFSVQVINII